MTVPQLKLRPGVKNKGASSMITRVMKRHPAEVEEFWENVRAKLWIEDRELPLSKNQTVSKRQKPGRRVRTLTIRMHQYGTHQTEMLTDKRRISMIPSAERR